MPLGPDEKSNAKAAAARNIFSVQSKSRKLMRISATQNVTITFVGMNKNYY
jgi:hypothetical protein